LIGNADQRPALQIDAKPCNEFVKLPIHCTSPHITKAECHHTWNSCLTKRNNTPKIQVVSKDDPLLSNGCHYNLGVRQALQPLVAQMQSVMTAVT